MSVSNDSVLAHGCLMDCAEQMNTSDHDPRYQYPISPQYYLGEIASASEMNVVVEEIDFYDALRELVPSVSQSEMEHYSRIQQKFRNSKPL